MGNPPAVIIVVRHGARLDAADPQWHLSSATPYDPPLTYGGWTQSKALGARIANILRNREAEDETLSMNTSSIVSKDRAKKKHKIVIHTSPYLRCIQTSIGISAGLAQNPHSISSHSKYGIDLQVAKTNSLAVPLAMGYLAPKANSEADTVFMDKSTTSSQILKIKRSTLRVDAFLGEWLTSDYFDQITPPPSSLIMVASAKADLLRREDYSHLINTRETKLSQPFPGGWGCYPSARDVGATEHEKNKEEGPLCNVSSLANALPNRGRPTARERSTSLISSGSHASRHLGASLQVEPPGSQNVQGIYQSPVPSYAISPSDPIPSGYVSHARDACLEVDYQWDSAREPLNWESGGEYGEEWSSMHKRFRTGLQNLIEWYQKSNETRKLLTRYRSNSLRLFGPEDEADKENTDLVVIIVTHGAGCNALIGALTNQPVLLDVGMASLTMAVRKPSANLSSTECTPLKLVKKPSISDQYAVKLIANNEHLRSSRSPTPSTSRAPSLSRLPAVREREISLSADPSHSTRTRPHNSSLGSIRRAASVITDQISRQCTSPRVNSMGLWSAPRYREEIEEDDMILNFGNNENTSESKSTSERKSTATFGIEKTPSLTSKEIQNDDCDAKWGLWGTCKATSASDKFHENRFTRWTIDDSKSMIGFGQTT